MKPSPHISSSLSLQPEMIDYNGHLNMAYYLVLFDKALDEFAADFGFGPTYIESANATIFTVEVHLRYLHEVRLSDNMVVQTQLIAHDAKRMHTYSEMLHAEDGWVAASSEQMFLHIDLATRTSAPWKPKLLNALNQLSKVHNRLAVPPEVGRAISMQKPANGAARLGKAQM